MVSTRRSSLQSAGQPPSSPAVAVQHRRSLLRRFSGTPVVAASAALSYALRESGGSPLAAAWRQCGANAALCLLASLITGEYSWVDRLWSVTPVWYALHFAAAGGWSARLALQAALVSLWGLRLTYNFGRKSGYEVGEQDYRW